VLNEMRAIENVVRAVLREAGLKLGTPARAAFAQRVRELAGDDQAVMPIIEPLLTILETMLAELARLTEQVLALARNEEICRRLWRGCRGDVCRGGLRDGSSAGVQ